MHENLHTSDTGVFLLTSNSSAAVRQAAWEAACLLISLLWFLPEEEKEIEKARDDCLSMQGLFWGKMIEIS